MSASPRLSMAKRVDSSGIDLNTSRFTLGVLRQYPSNASSTSSTPGVNETNLYGPAPTGAFLKPSSPTFMTFYGTMATGAGWIVPKKYVEKSGQGCLKRKRTRDGSSTSID